MEVVGSPCDLKVTNSKSTTYLCLVVEIPSYPNYYQAFTCVVGLTTDLQEVLVQ